MNILEQLCEPGAHLIKYYKERGICNLYDNEVNF